MYATVADVETYCTARAPFQANSKPSATQVAQLLQAATADVEAVLYGAGYALPIPSTATIAFEQIREACAVCAAEKVERSAPTSNRIEHYTKMCKEAKTALSLGQLPGVEVSNDGGSGTVRFAPDVATGPLFTRDMDL